AGARESRLLADLGQVTFAIVAVKLRVSCRSARSEHGTVGDKDIVRAVAVVIENGSPRAGALEDIVLLFLAAKCVGDGQSCLSGDIDEAEAGSVGDESKGDEGEGAGSDGELHLTASHLLQCASCLLRNRRIRSLGGLTPMLCRTG